MGSALCRSSKQTRSGRPPARTASNAPPHGPECLLLDAGVSDLPVSPVSSSLTARAVVPDRFADVPERAQDLRERPERDPLAVGQAAPDRLLWCGRRAARSNSATRRICRFPARPTTSRGVGSLSLTARRMPGGLRALHLARRAGGRGDVPTPAALDDLFDASHVARLFFPLAPMGGASRCAPTGSTTDTSPCRDDAPAAPPCARRAADVHRVRQPPYTRAPLGPDQPGEHLAGVDPDPALMAAQSCVRSSGRGSPARPGRPGARRPRGPPARRTPPSPRHR